MRALSAALGFTAVALGAFGAHGLKALLTENGTTAIWETAVLYHLAHAVAALCAGERNARAAQMWTLGVLIFSGSLYILAVTNIRWLGAITPIGGVLLLVGWVLVGFGTKRSAP